MSLPLLNKLKAQEDVGQVEVNPKARLLAAGMHLLVSTFVAALVLAIVFLGWYPPPLDAIAEVGDILLLLIAVDLVLGPVLTLIIFDVSKKSLSFDLGCIAVLQVVALLYGLYTVELGRPHYLVFVKDRFEVVSKADLHPADSIAGLGNDASSINWFSPKVAAAEMPNSGKERQDLMFEALYRGRDVQHLPKQYRDYATQMGLAASKGRPISKLRVLNPDGDKVLQSALDRVGLAEEELGFLPIKGPHGDATMLINSSTGAIAGIVALQPWR